SRYLFSSFRNNKIKKNIGANGARDVFINNDKQKNNNVQKYLLVSKKIREIKNTKLFNESICPQNALLYKTIGLKRNNDEEIIPAFSERFDFTMLYINIPKMVS